MWLVTLDLESGNSTSQIILVGGTKWPEPLKKHRPLRSRAPDKNVQGLMTISTKSLDHENYLLFPSHRQSDCPMTFAPVGAKIIFGHYGLADSRV
jgi:hypothetical protein